MQTQPANQRIAPSPGNWLRTYYFARAAVSAGWIVLVLAIGRANPMIAAVLLVAYPAWDALANYVDAQNSGGLRANVSQALNMAVSVLPQLPSPSHLASA